MAKLTVRKPIDTLTVGPTPQKVQEMLSAKSGNKAMKKPMGPSAKHPRSPIELKKKRKLNLKAGMLLLVLALIPSIANAQGPTNPCLQTNNIRQSSISIAAASTVKIVDNGTNPQRQILVCNFTLTIVGAATANTLQWNQGTGATCGTGNAAIGGVLTGPGAATDTMYLMSPHLPFGRLTAGNSLCATTTQASLVSGVLTFVFIGQATP